MNQPLLEVKNLVKNFPIRSGLFKRTVGHVHAVNDVSFNIEPGETFALVGESGCGKSTIGKTIMGFHRPTSGSVLFDGRDISRTSPAALREARKDVQFVFQDPYASLPARRTAEAIIREPLDIHRVGNREHRRNRVEELLELVGLRRDLATRYPHEFSGGQRQRIGIARALALEPKLLILDEPVSALDVSVQAQVINLLRRLQDDLGLAYVFVAHDLAIVRHLADRVGVMYLGTMVEHGDAEDVFSRPSHPYTRALLSAHPITDPRHRESRKREILEGELPDPSDPPTGCAFRTRCPLVEKRCAEARPLLESTGGRAAMVACHVVNHPVGARPEPARSVDAP